MTARTRLLPLLAGGLALTLGGCATYSRKPLPAAPDLASAVTVPSTRLVLPGLPPHPFNLARGLDETNVVTLAVLNNPELKAARLQAGVAAAQLLEAGLLPDPQVSAGISKSPAHTGYSVGLQEEIGALVTRGAARAAARAQARQVNLDILWQEWQVAEKARELFAQSLADQQLVGLLRPGRDLLLHIYRQQEAALAHNNASATTVAISLQALTNAEKTLRQVELDANQTHHDLNALLGLAPDVSLRLTGPMLMPSLPAAEFKAAVAALPHRRADLLALQAGYESQEEQLREAVLAQFPAIGVGVQQARSAEEGINSVGLTIGLRLPLFNRNRGQIAIQRATRAQLRQEYQARLDQAVSDASRLWQATKIIARQEHQLDARLPDLRRTADAAARGYRHGEIDASAYAALAANVQSQEAAAINLRVSLAKAQAALTAVLGLPQ